MLWGQPKKVVQRAFQNHVDCLQQKEFLQWNTGTKDHLCANFQDIWLSSKSWISDIRYAISTIKTQILNQFFLQNDSLYCCYMCAKFSSTCKIIFIFSCMLSSVLWDNFLWMTLYLCFVPFTHPAVSSFFDKRATVFTKYCNFISTIKYVCQDKMLPLSYFCMKSSMNHGKRFALTNHDLIGSFSVVYS